ncbi:MAG: ATP-binding protein [Draconibacterium sp.]
MNQIERSVTAIIKENLKPNKVVVLLGARRTGKSFLVKNILSATDEKYLFLDGDDFTTQNLLQPRTVENFKSLLGNIRFLIIDEAQQLPDLGKSLKLMIDHIPELKILITGSSAFDIMNKTGEPLTGRKTTILLFPFSQAEYSTQENIIETTGRLNERLILGSYPELLHLDDRNQKIAYLKELVSSYLLKDILAFEGIRNADKIIHLLKLIAFQIGKEVSLHELGGQLGLHKNTVEKYLDLLSKTFVIFSINAYSKNLRNEISKSKRWFFYDNGIRNIIIENMNDIALRNDVGELWENYIFSERIKYQHFRQMLVSNYFWRTYQQQEIDWIEEREGKLFAYEMKWNPDKKVKIPNQWKATYPDSDFEVITPKNYLHWIS